MTFQLYHGDCLDIMPTLEAQSFDAIIADLPYGTTACKWDTVIPFEPLWAEYKRLIKPRGAIVLFSQQPFTTVLISSMLPLYKYTWVWDKRRPPDFYAAKFRPLTVHEDISIFSNGGASFGSKVVMSYFPILEQRDKPMPYKDYRENRKNPKAASLNGKPEFSGVSTHKYPKTILSISAVARKESLHPTQKPVALLEYLIRTYTNEGDTVLDNVMGSGTTGVACQQTGRSFVGIEKDAAYFEIAKRRIEAAQLPLLATG